VGFYYNAGSGENRVRQTGSAGAYTLYTGTAAANTVANPPPWDFDHQDVFPVNNDTDFNETALPLTTYTHTISHGSAMYGVLDSMKETS
jgi:hypothetical protein